MPDISDNPIGEEYLIQTGSTGYIIRLMARMHDDARIAGCAVVAPWTPLLRMVGSYGVDDSYIGGEGLYFKPDEAHFDYETPEVARYHLEFLFALPNLSELSAKDAFLAAAQVAYQAAQAKFLTERREDLLKRHGANSLPQLLEIIDPASTEGKELIRICDGLEALLRK